MHFTRAITPTLMIGDQPTDDDLEMLKAEGYTGVVNLRQDGEPEQPIRPEAEGKLLEELGLDYLHVPVGGSPFSSEGVGAFQTFLGKHEGSKVLIHCRKGGRAAAMLLLHEALVNGWTADEAAAQGHDIGLDVDGGLKMMVEHYLRNNPTSAT